MHIPAPNISKIKGLTNVEVETSRAKYGRNVLSSKKDNTFLLAIKNILKEPMVILLLVASSIYFISGEIGDGVFLASAIILVAIISLHQDSRSRNAIEKLKVFYKVAGFPLKPASYAAQPKPASSPHSTPLYWPQPKGQSRGAHGTWWQQT